MSEAITSIAPLPAALAPLPTTSGVTRTEENFMHMVTRGLGEVNLQLQSTQTELQQLAVGGTQNLHQVMIHLEEARMSFQLLLQVRNRVLDAYQDLMKMSV
jgi:flagellar hook-basal body complex protein FliE